MIDSTYRDLLNEVVRFAIEKTKDESLYRAGDLHGAGYRLAMYSFIHMIESEAASWGLNPSDVGLGKFSSDDWLREGIDYWKKDTSASE